MSDVIRDFINTFNETSERELTVVEMSYTLYGERRCWYLVVPAFLVDETTVFQDHQLQQLQANPLVVIGFGNSHKEAREAAEAKAKTIERSDDDGDYVVSLAIHMQFPVQHITGARVKEPTESLFTLDTSNEEHTVADIYFDGKPGERDYRDIVMSIMPLAKELGGYSGFAAFLFDRALAMQCGQHFLSVMAYNEDADTIKAMVTAPKFPMAVGETPKQAIAALEEKMRSVKFSIAWLTDIGDFTFRCANDDKVSVENLNPYR